MRFPQSAAAILVYAAWLLHPLSAQPTRTNAAADRPDATMQHLVDDLASHHHRKVSLYAKAIRTGQTVSINPDTPVNTASVIKVAIMLEAIYQIKDGKL